MRQAADGGACRSRRSPACPRSAPWPPARRRPVDRPSCSTNGPVVAALGDSYLSGQGAPDVPVQAECHRCRRRPGDVAGPRLCPVHALGAGSRRPPPPPARSPGRARTVNLVNEACSDATIAAGLLGVQHLSDGTVRPSQLDQLAKAVGSRPVDALLVDGGGNDVHFGDILLNCANPLHDCSTDATVQRELRAGLLALNGPHGDDGLYRSLIAALNGTPGHPAKVRVKAVYVTAYPDPTRNAAGGPCSSAPGGDPLAGITAREAAFGSGIVASLNHSLAAMVTQANAATTPHPVVALRRHDGDGLPGQRVLRRVREGRQHGPRLPPAAGRPAGVRAPQRVRLPRLGRPRRLAARRRRPIRGQAQSACRRPRSAPPDHLGLGSRHLRTSPFGQPRYTRATSSSSASRPA